MRKWLPLFTICLGTFMLLIDVTIVNVALPDLVSDLHASFSAVQWVVDGYALSLAALVLGAGSIADLVGHRRAYVAGLALFAVSSAVCGVAPNAGLLVGARVVQGIGAAAMFATTFALLNSNYTGRDRGTAYGLWGAVSGAAAAIGPILGGILTESISWRWIFYVNIPISIIAIVLTVRAMTDAHGTHDSKVDYWGIATFTGAAAAVTYGLIRANEKGWTNSLSWVMFVGFVLLLAAFVAIEHRTPHAMFDLGLLRNGPFVGVLVAGLLLTSSAFAIFTYTSIWLQSVQHLSPLRAGLVGLPMSVTAFFISAVIGRFLHGGGAGRIIGGGLLFIGIGDLIAAAQTHGSAGWAALIAGFAVSGIGVGLATPTLGSAAMSAVPLQRGGMAAGAVNTTRQLGFAIGIAVLGTAFTARAGGVLRDHDVPNADAAARAVAGGESGRLIGATPPNLRGAADQAVHASSVAGVQTVLLVAGLIGVFGAVLTFVLVRDKRGGGVSLDAGPEEGHGDDGTAGASDGATGGTTDDSTHGPTDGSPDAAPGTGEPATART